MQMLIEPCDPEGSSQAQKEEATMKRNISSCLACSREFRLRHHYLYLARMNAAEQRMHSVTRR